jgi:hypothetical protein
MRLSVPDGLARCWRRQRSRRRDAPIGNAAPVSQGMTSGELVASLRQIDGQRDKGKHPPNLHFRSKPFLHSRNGPDQTYADVRLGGDFEPVTGSTPKQREVLLEQVKAHVTAELASRQQKRG